MDPNKQIGDVFNNLVKLQWAHEPMTLLQLIESLEMPQLARIVRSNLIDVRENEFLLLQSVYDRYVLLGYPTNSYSNEICLIPDWYRAQCKIRTNNPRIQKQYWNFQGATELNRFDLPRSLNFLVETPIYQFSHKLGGKAEWKRVVLKRNTKLTAIKLYPYSLNSVNQGSCFILVDSKGSQFLLPTDFNVKFSVEIAPDEYNGSYFDHKGIFSLPEIITRYELPIEIEFTPGTEPGSIPASKLPTSSFRIVSVAIAKSIVGAVYNAFTKQFRYIELSPATQIRLSIPKCLQQGLLNPDANLTQEEENEYTLYNKTREMALNLCHKQCELYKFDMRSASIEERDAMLKIFEAGIKYKAEEAILLRDNYLLDLNSQEASNPDGKIPFISLKNMFLRPNIDEGDPYDDVNHEADNDDGRQTVSHDLSSISRMPERLITDVIPLN